MLWLQGMRVESVVGKSARNHLDIISRMREDEVDQLVKRIRDEYDLHVIFTHHEGRKFAPLMVPSSGIFKFAHEDSSCLTGYSIGVGLPLDQSCALAATRRNENSLADLQPMSHRIANLSLGTSEATQVVIDPDIRASTAANELIEELRLQRATNDELVHNVYELREAVRRLYEEKGASVKRDRGGRLSL